MKYEVKESLSNLSYSVVGIIGYILHGDPLFLVLMIQMSVGSFLFHKYKDGNPDIDRADWFAIHLTLLASGAYLIGTAWAWVAMGVFSTLYGYVIMKRTPSVYFDVALSAVPCILACYYAKGFECTLFVLGIFVLSLIVRKKDDGEDQTHHHDSWGHSVWHIGTSFMFYLIWYL